MGTAAVSPRDSSVTGTAAVSLVRDATNLSHDWSPIRHLREMGRTVDVTTIGRGMNPYLENPEPLKPLHHWFPESRKTQRP
jgi:hypothetical protein